MAQELINQINPNAKILTDDQRLRPEQSEFFRLYGANDKIKEHTKWEQKLSLSEGLHATIEWFKNPDNLSKYKADIYNI